MPLHASGRHFDDVRSWPLAKYRNIHSQPTADMLSGVIQETTFCLTAQSRWHHRAADSIAAIASLYGDFGSAST
jgi:hypothetical protein